MTAEPEHGLRIERGVVDDILPPDPEVDAFVLAETPDDPAPWERLGGEPDRAYTRFQRYLAEGEGRSLRAFAQAEAHLDARRTPQESMAVVRATARRWDWERRAAAHDEYLAQKLLADYRAERLAVRQRRREVLRAYLNMVTKQMRRLDERAGIQMDYGQVTSALRMLTEELRAEYDDRPDDRLAERAVAGGTVLAVDIQRMLVRIEAEYGA